MLIHFESHGQRLEALKALGAGIEEEKAASSVTSEAPSSEAADSLAPLMRGKVNEIDFCLAPADVSLSRAYGITSSSKPKKIESGEEDLGSSGSALSPTMSLTRALNNASNRAVRRILLSRSWPSAEALNQSLRQVAAAVAASNEASRKAGRKCPVPQPILKVLTRKRDTKVGGTSSKAPNSSSRSRTDAEYVSDQIMSFREKYGHLSGYRYAEDYLECVLSLATVGVESSKVANVLSDGVYDESYRRILGVLGTAGILWNTPSDGANGGEIGPRRMAEEMKDQDICLSMMDKISMKKETQKRKSAENSPKEIKGDGEDAEETELTNKYLGGVLLSAKEPTITRQLNKLANIVQRALLFGGDQELLVLAETLDADCAAFTERWYPTDGGDETPDPNPPVNDVESRPGLQYLRALIQLLRNCYNNGVVTNLEPPVPLLNSYANAYERLVATAVELGSGYLKPSMLSKTMPIPRTAREELGRFAVWESNFRQSSTTKDVSAYPEDLEGSWEVRDEIAGETIGTSKVQLLPDGNVLVASPLQGLRWRLDPGPTHLDTCTFQVLSDDGTILQYRGFIDRGARLEARFSKRSIAIRGSVQFQMRDGNVDYYQDMLPINYREGTTKFVMTKIG